MTLSAGTKLGPYEVLGPLGVGGMGEVYRARDTKLDRDVAIKVLPERLATDPTALGRFEREAKTVAALSHPNLLGIYDFGTHDGVLYAVTELLSGETLRDRLTAGPIPRRKALEYALQIARGLGAAHEHGVVHRDLKPENVFVTNDGRVKILDFGLAKPLLPETGVSGAATFGATEPGTVLGTVGYMSPEQVRGKPADHRSDIFAFGAILYEMLSGQRAFKGDSAVETMNAILIRDLPEPSGPEEGNLPQLLDRIVRHCIEKNPEERFQSVRDVAFDLEALSGSTSSATQQLIAPARGKPRWLAPAAGLALALLVAG
ncbi:MAG TPA: serine/threonine-protein kinase, partial [Thermoanaerobaculia bacterium]|nr:serine/threonine-protein kinase [Thermoanaerobaculia bacterium]